MTAIINHQPYPGEHDPTVVDAAVDVADVKNDTDDEFKLIVTGLGSIGLGGSVEDQPVYSHLDPAPLIKMMRKYVEKHPYLPGVWSPESRTDWPTVSEEDFNGPNNPQIQ